MGQVIVGVDGSECGAAALRWALREAEMREWQITAALAWSYLDQRPAEPGKQFDPHYSEEDADKALDAAVEAAVGSEASGRVDRKAICDLPAQALLRASQDADLLVLGSRGRGGFKGLLLGSVSEQCLHHARCPVAIVRGTGTAPDESATHEGAHTPRERIVVGVDGSETGQRGLHWALEEARARHAALDAACAWRSPIVGVRRGTARLDRAAIKADARRVLDQAIDAADTSGLPGPIGRIVRSGSATQVLLEAADGADLIVVGSRGLGGFRGLLLGAVSQQIARHAPCPVVIVK